LPLLLPLGTRRVSDFTAIVFPERLRALKALLVAKALFTQPLFALPILALHISIALPAGLFIPEPLIPLLGFTTPLVFAPPGISSQVSVAFPLIVPPPLFLAPLFPGKCLGSPKFLVALKNLPALAAWLETGPRRIAEVAPHSCASIPERF
jgi:hypothetical protein